MRDQGVTQTLKGGEVGGVQAQCCLVGAAGISEVSQVTADTGHLGVTVEGSGVQLGSEGREVGSEGRELGSEGRELGSEGREVRSKGREVGSEGREV